MANRKLKNNALNLSRANGERSRRLRREQTVSEQLVWHELRNEKTGFKFRRQHPVGAYVLDFFCPEAMVCVEVDGPHHETCRTTDELRDNVLAGLGVLTIRLPAVELFSDTRTELGRLIRELKATLLERVK